MKEKANFLILALFALTTLMLTSERASADDWVENNFDPLLYATVIAGSAVGIGVVASDIIVLRPNERTPAWLTGTGIFTIASGLGITVLGFMLSSNGEEQLLAGQPAIAIGVSGIGVGIFDIVFRRRHPARLRAVGATSVVTGIFGTLGAASAVAAGTIFDPYGNDPFAFAIPLIVSCVLGPTMIVTGLMDIVRYWKIVDSQVIAIPTVIKRADGGMTPGLGIGGSF